MLYQNWNSKEKGMTTEESSIGISLYLQTSGASKKEDNQKVALFEKFEKDCFQTETTKRRKIMNSVRLF